MDKIKINGRWIAEDNGIKEEVSRAFQKLLSATDEWRPNLSEDLRDFRPISMVGECISGWLRQITDAMLISNEAIDSILKSKGGQFSASWILRRLMEALSCLIKRAVREGILSPCQVRELASELGCKVGSLPSLYLGMPLGAPFKSMAA
ncbi:hypothetical protein CK203_052784 [Vitis vinifera]|uniref:Uncharacterized protein n=1 Tax=Vitis vinifera TaxID=29760 RepID=A0A438FUT3_VITVI|nr:hypothetical protein CK203_052784 [Vitis vinifera]